MGSTLFNVVLLVQALAGLAVIGLVLVQHGKGADMGAAFGSGASGSLFGASGSANFLSRATAVLAAVFFAATLALVVIAKQGRDANAAREASERPVPELQVQDESAPPISQPALESTGPATTDTSATPADAGGASAPAAPETPAGSQNPAPAKAAEIPE